MRFVPRIQAWLNIVKSNHPSYTQATKKNHYYINRQNKSIWPNPAHMKTPTHMDAQHMENGRLCPQSGEEPVQETHS